MHAIEVDEATFAALEQYADAHAVGVQELIAEFAATLRSKGERSFARQDAKLDEALQETFPASDPPELDGHA